MKKKTVLFVMARLPFPASSGRKNSLYHYCHIISQELGYRLVVASFLENEDDPNDKPDFIDRLIVLPKASIIMRTRNIIKESMLLHRKPLQVSLYWNPKANAIIKKVAQEEKPEYVIGDMVRSIEYIKDIPSYRISDLDDRISLRYQRQLETDIENINPYGAFLGTVPQFIKKIMLIKPIKLAVVKNEIALLKTYEIEMGRICDRTVFVAQNEAVEFNKELGEKKAIAVPIGVDVEYFDCMRKENSGCLIGFLGAMSVAHNENAARHFIVDILPLVVERVPNAKFMIIGGGVSDQLRKLQSEYVIFTDYVDDVRDYLSKCKVFVCPMNFGSGIKTKNLEAMSMGIPIVTTAIGAENIDASNGTDWFIEDDYILFAKRIIELLNNENLRKQLSINSAKYIRENWTWNNTKKALETLLK